MNAPDSPFHTASSYLLAPNQLQAEQLSSVFGSMLAHKLDYADLYFQYTRAEGWSLEEGIVKSGSFNIDQGVGVRAVSGEKTAFAYSDDISLPALQDAAAATRAIARQGGKGKAALIRRATTGGRELYRGQDPLASLPDAEKVRLLREELRREGGGVESGKRGGG